MEHTVRCRSTAGKEHRHTGGIVEYRIVEGNDEILYTAVSGTYSEIEGTRIIEELHEECEKRKKRKLLVDITGKDGVIPVADRFFFGKQIAGLYRYNVKMAVIGRKSHITRFSETVAVNRGGNLGIFDNKPDAVAWLKSTHKKR